jgi:protein O-GlcNAc transferase
MQSLPEPSSAEFNALLALYNARRYAETENRARALLDQYPESGLLWKLLGAALQMQGKDALPVLRNAAKHLPADAEAHNSLGSSLQEHDIHDEAVMSYRRALKIEPGFVEAHYNLGNALWELGKLEDAITSYRSALKINPNISVIHNNLGSTLQEFGQLNEALACCRRALELEPDSALMRSNLLGILNCTPGYASSYILEEALQYGRVVAQKVASRFSS